MKAESSGDLAKRLAETMSDRTLDEQAALAKLWAPMIATALKAAFCLGFDHAVEGGEEAARQLPELKDKLPLVLYFENADARCEMVDAVHAFKPELVQARWPESSR